MDETKKEVKGRSLINLVFSWSIADVLNKNLYNSRVKEIPTQFSSILEYMSSFKYPLIEETHADLRSSMLKMSKAATCQIVDAKVSKGFKPPKDLLYDVTFKRSMDTSNAELYEPEAGDLIAFTDIMRPKCIDDINKRSRPYLIAVVQRPKNENSGIVKILASKPLLFEMTMNEKLFAVYLTNLTTNIRIWASLNSELNGGDLKIFKTLLHRGTIASDVCLRCSVEGSDVIGDSLTMIRSFGLDDSQKAAIKTCVATRECKHQNVVKLIWGPPGTGKTKTVASLLFVLLQMNCRALTCAPTNVAVIGVTQRLMGYVRESLIFDTYGLGDILLFGNGERMRIDDHEDLHDVFLDYRVHVLAQCFAPLTGWKGSLDSMISLLEDPAGQYDLYLGKEQREDDSDEYWTTGKDEDDEGSLGENDLDKNKDEETAHHLRALNTKDIWKKYIEQTIGENKKKKQQKNSSASSKKKGAKHVDCDRKDANVRCDKNAAGPSNKTDNLLTFDEFFPKKFNSIGERLIFCFTTLYTHLPTKILSLDTGKRMIKSIKLIHNIRSLIHKKSKLDMAKHECLQELVHLKQNLSVHGVLSLTDDYLIRSFCLQNTQLLFCTASSSAKLHTEGMVPIEMLVIDEAAQLKECESTIPLQLKGLRNAILVGDEKQLPAMVQSEICAEAEFGRSLFERMVLLGQNKQLLRVQYRMHPSISSFPNREFYGKQILDGQNVWNRGYQRRFLQESMFGSYSFINVSNGTEGFDQGHSKKNTVEAFLVAELVAKLHQAFVGNKRKVSVGCISPYKAQVSEIEEIIGKKYSMKSDGDFSVKVRSVDGFQGAEEDVIIISTVRCNARGSIGFLQNPQRANVALTRARYCLWILGNGATLENSDTLWKSLVDDAKKRGCFHDAMRDENLVETIKDSLIKSGNIATLLHPHSLLFRAAKWKVCFDDNFMNSISRVKSHETLIQVCDLLTKLASGWRRGPQNLNNIVKNDTDSTADRLEIYEVSGRLSLVWMVDLAIENFVCTQVLKIWDILRPSKTSTLVTRLSAIFENYTVDQMKRCKFKRLKGDLVIPETWHFGTPASGGRSQHLTNLFSSLSLNDNSASSSSSPSTQSVGNHTWSGGRRGRTRRATRW